MLNLRNRFKLWRKNREERRAQQPCGRMSGLIGWPCEREYKHDGQHRATISTTRTDGVLTGSTTVEWSD